MRRRYESHDLKIEKKPVKMQKVHVGCSTIYLTPGWLNVDLPSPESGCALAKDCPAGVQQWSTSEDKYFGRHTDVSIESLEKGYGSEHHRDKVCDAYGSFDSLPCDDNDVEEILARQVFEHMSIREAEQALIESYRVLIDGGILRLDVPDHEASLEEYKNTGRSFFKRHIFGSRRNTAAYHIMGWTRESLTSICKEYGFEFVEEEPNIHIYPAFCLRFRKVTEPDVQIRLIQPKKPWIAAWQYCGDPIGGPLTFCDAVVGGGVLEVGCGSQPWPRADVFFDINSNVKQYLPFEKQNDEHFKVGDVEDLPEEWTSKFHYVFASHILEHCGDPVRAAGELTRVARSGCVVCPSAWKEGLFLLHEQDHKWCALPTSKPNTLRLLKYDPEWKKEIHNEDASKIMHQILRLERKRFGRDGRELQHWFHNAEPRLDVIVKWSGKLNVEILE